MTLEQKNTVLLSKDDDLYQEWGDQCMDLPEKIKFFFTFEKKADDFVRYWLGALKDKSPFLIRLFLTEQVFLKEIIEKGYSNAFAGLLKQSFSFLYNCDQDIQDIGRELRILKRRCALLIALADLSGQWNLKKVTSALSVLADACLRIAVCAVLKKYHKKGDLVLPDSAFPEKECGFFLIAMGKLGAKELNYSSDIDLIVLFDAQKAPYKGKKDINDFFVRLTREVVALIDDKTSYGYVFRTDLRLRPDPGSTPVALSTQAAACYYESFAQNWERAAFIKARVVAGDKLAGNDFLKEIKPFIWRRTTDFYALQQIGDIKRSLGNRSANTPDKAGFNVKLGRGGIREIEFFTQLQQLLWGGRDLRLRCKSTLAALKALTKAGWVGFQDCQDLSEAYVFLRTIEHRLQMQQDQQTQVFPQNISDLETFARFSGFDNYDEFLKILVKHCSCVRRIYDSLFLEEDEKTQETISFSGTDLPQETADYLKASGFKSEAVIAETVRGWLSGRYRALRSVRARELMSDLLYSIFNALAKTKDPDGSFLAFDEFLKELPAGIQLFSLFQSRPALLDLLIELISVAPVLSRELIHHNDLFDAVLNPSFFSGFPDAEDLKKEALSLLELAEDDEQALDTLRRFVREKKFCCAVLFLRNLIDKNDLGFHLNNLVKAAFELLRPIVIKNFEKKYGRFETSSFSVVLLGKAGSAEMNFSSDLDILFIYDVDEKSLNSAYTTATLSPSAYFSRLAQRFVNALTLNTKEGVLWPVDMRLRPSGNAGPAATSFDAFVRYYSDQAWTWELMALTKASVIWGNINKITDEIHKRLCQFRQEDILQRDIRSMREKIKHQFHSDNVLQTIKYKEGGMIDIEFSAQYLQLRYACQYPDILKKAVVPVLTKVRDYGLINTEKAEILIKTYQFFTLTSALFSVCEENADIGFDDVSFSTLQLIRRFYPVDTSSDLRKIVQNYLEQSALNRLF